MYEYIYTCIHINIYMYTIYMYNIYLFQVSMAVSAADLEGRSPDIQLGRLKI